jgi:hypothetical protein
MTKITFKSIIVKVLSFVDPYWYVDLGGIYMIRHIDIFNRRKTSGGYFSQFILVSVLTAINISVMKTALNTI